MAAHLQSVDSNKNVRLTTILLGAQRQTFDWRPNWHAELSPDLAHSFMFRLLVCLESDHSPGSESRSIERKHTDTLLKMEGERK